MNTNNTSTTSSDFDVAKITYKQPDIIFQINGSNKEIIKVTNYGDIYIKGNLITNDKEILRYLKKISISNYRENLKNEIRTNPQLFDEIISELRKEKINKLLNK